jgi:hypothetical protein
MVVGISCDKYCQEGAKYFNKIRVEKFKIIAMSIFKYYMHKNQQYGVKMHNNQKYGATKRTLN